MLSLELHRTGIADRGAATVWVVPALDEREDGPLRFGWRGEPPSIQQLAYHGGEEALRHGVIVAISNSPH